MLQIGFLHEVEEIIKVIPASRQSMLFSATIPEEIKNLANTYMRCPLYVQVEKKQGPALNVKQLAIYTTDRAKQATLIHLIRTHRPFLAVIFCRTKRRVTKLYEALKLNGFRCDELHGDLSQAKREQVMKHFRDADIQLLIATDVAARGLDVEGVTHVFNYDIPLDSDSYVHRVGRTGRAGMKGIAITLYTSKDRNILDIIEKELHLKIKKQDERSLNKPENKQGTQRELTVNKKAISRNKKQVLTDPKQTHQEPHLHLNLKKAAIDEINGENSSLRTVHIWRIIMLKKQVSNVLKNQLENTKKNELHIELFKEEKDYVEKLHLIPDDVKEKVTLIEKNSRERFLKAYIERSDKIGTTDFN